MAAVGGGGGGIAMAEPVGGPEFLLLPEPEGGVLNHGGPDNVPEEGARNPLEMDTAKVLKVTISFV
jgi:hypothetical protein